MPHRQVGVNDDARTAVIDDGTRGRASVVMGDFDDIVGYWNQGAAQLLSWPSMAWLEPPIVNCYPTLGDNNDESQVAALRFNACIEPDLQSAASEADVFVQGVATPVGRSVGRPAIANEHSTHKESESLLRAVIEGTDDAVFVKDVEGRYLLFNEAAAKFVGRKTADVLGRTDADLFDFEGARLVRERDLRVMETGQIETEEERLTAAGSTRVYLAMKAPYRDIEGRMAGTIGISRDITERKQNEDRLRLQSLVLDSMSEGVLIGDGTGCICYTNPAQDTMFGYSRGELLKQPPHRLYADRNFAQTILAQLLAHSIGDGFSWSGEVTSIRRDGIRFTTFARISTIRCDSQYYWTIVHEDITERKAWHEQRHQTKKMEAIGRLAGGIAHDFNNLLTVIAGATDLLISQQSPEANERSLLHAIREAGGRAATLTRQLLAFSQRQLPAPAIIDLNQIVQRLTTMLKPAMGSHIRWINDLASEPVCISADASQLEQAVTNLILNSRDALTEPGCLTIRTRIADMVVEEHSANHIDPTIPTRKRTAELEIIDTGHGMSLEVQSRMFEPFYTTKGLGRGTGLGLAVAHGIVEQARGEVTVESAIGVGTTFYLRFPLALTSEIPADNNAPAQTTNLGETVLVVDREPMIRQVTRRTLEGIGYRILEAQDATEAIDIVEAFQGDIHLIIADLRLPTIDGRQLTDAIRVRDPKVRSLYFMAAEEIEISNLPDLPPRRHLLRKPFSAQQLVDRVRHLLQNQEG